MIKNLLVGATVLVILFVLLARWESSPAQAQTGEICVAPQPDGDYGDVPTFSEDPIPANGWSGSGTSFSFGANYARFGSTITGGTANLTKTLTLDDQHSAALVAITAQASSGRTGSIVVTLGGAQQASLATFGSTLQTITRTLAQGTSHSQLLQLFGSSNGQLTIYEVALQPTDLITRTTESFLDPNLNGIEWPTWFRFVGEAVSNSGSRSVNGTFGFEIGNGKISCSPIVLGTYLDVSDLITVTFTARGTGNTSGNVSSLIRQGLTPIGGTYGPSVDLSNGGFNPYTMQARMNFTATEGIGYFCFKTNVFGSSGQMQFDDFAMPVCEIPITPTPAPLVGTTLAYTLPTTGDIVIYQRLVTSEDILTATAIWGLVILVVSATVYQVARGRL